MTLRPIPGAPAGAPIPDFPSDGAKPFTDQPAPTAPVPPPAPAKPHWTARTDEIGSVRIAPRRGYSTESLFIRLFRDGSLVVDTVELSPSAAGRFIALWQTGRGEFEYEVSPVATLYAHWVTYDDGQRGFYVHHRDRLRSIADQGGIWRASEREANRALRELFILRGRVG